MSAMRPVMHSLQALQEMSYSYVPHPVMKSERIIWWNFSLMHWHHFIPMFGVSTGYRRGHRERICLVCKVRKYLSE